MYIAYCVYVPLKIDVFDLKKKNRIPKKKYRCKYLDMKYKDELSM